jgi:hypothetical protein
MKILSDNKEQLVILSELLIEREVLDFADVDAIMKTGKLPEASADAPAPVAEAEAPAAEEKQGPDTWIA